MTEKKPACGNPGCRRSTSIDDVTLTFGSGALDDYGFWERPCYACALAYQKDHPDRPVWPSVTEEGKKEKGP